MPLMNSRMTEEARNWGVGPLDRPARRTPRHPRFQWQIPCPVRENRRGIPPRGGRNIRLKVAIGGGDPFQ